MGRVFNGTSDYLEATSAAVTAYPMTLACWAMPRDLTAAQQQLMAVSEAATFRAISLVVRSTGRLRARSSDSAGTAASAEQTSPIAVVGAWIHAAAVFTGDADRTVYANGIAANNTTSITTGVINFNRSDIGVWAANSTRQEFFAGVVAHAAIWNVALSRSEIEQLACGKYPWEVRPEAMVDYVPIAQNSVIEVSARSGRVYVPNGSVHFLAEPPRLHRIAGPRFYNFSPLVVAPNPKPFSLQAILAQ